MPDRFDPARLLAYAEDQLERRVMIDLPPGKPYPAWDWSFLCEALLNAHRRTGDDRNLDLVRAAINHAFSLRDCDRGMVDPRFGEPRQTWGVSIEGRWANVVTTPGRIVTPASDYLEMVGVDDEVLARCVVAVESCLPDFVEFDDEGLFRRPAKGDWEPLNHAASIGRALLRLARITGNERYAGLVRRLATFFKRSLVIEEGGYYGWAYRPNPENRQLGYPTNYWKADIDLAFVVDCYKQGLVFDGSDIARFIETLKRGVLRPDFLNCKVASKKAVPLREKAAKIGPRAYGICGWMVLAEFDADVESLIENALADHSDVMTGGWFGVPHAAWGYSFKQ